MKKNKRIALLNIQRCDSHGAVLLAYALEQVCIANGYEVQNLDYKYAGRIIEKNILKKILKKAAIIIKKKLHLSYANKKIFGLSLKKMYDLQSENFTRFRNEHLHLTKEVTDVNDEILQDYDTFVVGSDVVWKPEIVACEDREIYFLKSVPKNAIKIAYAASVGTDEEAVLEKYDGQYAGAFDELDYISIREQSMIPFVKKYTDKQVESVIDPVFLLSAEEYQQIEKNDTKKVNPGQYIYVYLLGENKVAIEEANRMAEEQGLSVLVDLNASFEDSKLFTVESECAISAGPSEFLYNIRNAKYVITDSFHATAFALIFNRELCVFKRGKISVRMSDLLHRFNISERMYEGELKKDVINWEKINRQIDTERENGLRYLLESMKGKCSE